MADYAESAPHFAAFCHTSPHFATLRQTFITIARHCSPLLSFSPISLALAPDNVVHAMACKSIAFVTSATRTQAASGLGA
jgi:hypothetical protein